MFSYLDVTHFLVKVECIVIEDTKMFYFKIYIFDIHCIQNGCIQYGCPIERVLI